MEVETTHKKNTFKENLSKKYLTKSSVYHSQYHQMEAMPELTMIEEIFKPIILSHEQKLESTILGDSQLLLRSLKKKVSYHILKFKL